MTKLFSLNSIFLFLFLVLFPFGQIISFGVVKPVDVVAGLAALYTVLAKLPKSEVFKHVQTFLVFAGIAWLFSIVMFPQKEILWGLLYLTRLTAYSYFFVYIWNFVKTKARKSLLINSLIGVAVAAAVFGWLQYFWFPDLRPFFPFGWDEHLFRIFGTFLDPAYLGLILVFALLILIYRYISTKTVFGGVLILFLAVTLAFTYSRASYLALVAGLFIILLKSKKIKVFLYLVAGFAALILLLPTSKNTILNFTRQFSALSRIENYKATLTIFNESPVFGVGYNNMCLAYQKFIGPQDFSSHACSGSDSSILFILTTCGVVGLMIFIYSVVSIKSHLPHSTFNNLLSSTLVALLVHSLFSNSMFYPWIMGWVAILLAVTL